MLTTDLRLAFKNVSQSLGKVLEASYVFRANWGSSLDGFVALVAQVALGKVKIISRQSPESPTAKRKITFVYVG